MALLGCFWASMGLVVASLGCFRASMAISLSWKWTGWFSQLRSPTGPQTVAEDLECIVLLTKARMLTTTRNPSYKKRFTFEQTP